MNRCAVTLITYAFFVLGASAQQNKKNIQVNINKLLNARPVTTATDGKLQNWTIGIDGAGKGDGYLTATAASLNGDKNTNALPDNPLIPSNSHHPEILLHYKNGDAGNQAHNIAGVDSFKFNVPREKYSDFYLSLTSSEGPSRLHITLNYTNGSETKDFRLPDYYNDIPENDPDLSYVVHNLAKWNPQNKMAEADHHNIDAMNIHPDEKRILKNIVVSKEHDGYLVFWAATGVIR
ncbi:hypothetical protein [Mucilaginibacter celer]|uniref:Rhamnogalacturonan lyase domain-containing protein n=1 Tax=Mucilaginibacter celer TaxID=2305508 RepID=A0A494W5E9_9SPHI|nr:hypothetical protein [Mucilaginibacter celer]AYL98788.1 hypothetical protein HYN43_027510 [Mucilaginibacter celer]